MLVSYDKYASIRDERGLNDYQVAVKAGINQPTFPNWKAGRGTPKTDKLFKIAQVLGVAIEDLLEVDYAVPKA